MTWREKANALVAQGYSWRDACRQLGYRSARAMAGRRQKEKASTRLDLALTAMSQDYSRRAA